ncbi:MAG: LysR substrate-binding domain-containing protein [Bacteroidales bacterium]
MTIQQMEYIVAVNKYRHFVTASEQCGVTQPTLSTMIQRLEEELGIKIFDRSKHPVEPTAIGVRIIRQAEVALAEMKRIKELVETETETLSGVLRIGVIPTLAPYLVPDLIRILQEEYPGLILTIHEMTTSGLVGELQKGFIDMMIAATPLDQADFLEIPLYYEKFVAYFSERNPFPAQSLSAGNMPAENLWVLQEGHCLRDQTFNFCKNYTGYNKIYEAGSIDTLVKIVDRNGGYSVIPELHLPFLSDRQRKNIREISSPPAVREISLVIRKDFIKERMLNAVANAVKQIIPLEMIDERLKKFTIRL